MKQINLLKPELLAPRRKPFSAAFMLRALGLLLLAGTALYGYLRMEQARLAQAADRAEQALAAERGRLQQLSERSAPGGTSKLLEEELKAAEARLRQYQALEQTLEGRDLGDAEGYSEYMRALARQAIDGLWLTGFVVSGAGTELVIRGHVLEPKLLPLYLERLNAEPAMRGRSFEALEIQAPKSEAAGSTAGHDATVRFLAFELSSKAPIKEVGR
ncbi:hypothetical protein [Pelomicrobium sp. G1]|uniref:hypothetical protein n=1 Tax=unclassified Pelomicrobium TaxID=2815318 RepID=UPI003F75B979